MISVITKRLLKIDEFELPVYTERHLAQAELLQQLKALLDDCGLGMYTPVFTIEEAMQHRLLAIDILNRLERSQSEGA